MRILIIAPYYHPYNNPRALRWTAIAEEFVENGHAVEILTSKGTQKNKPKIKEGVKIHRVFFNSLKEIIERNKKSKRADNLKGENSGITKQLNEKIWQKIYFPDNACLWYFSAKNYALNLLKKRKFDALISVSLPFTAQLIGLRCKEKFPNLKWIADIGDPFAFQNLHPINNYFLYKNWNIKIERKILENADYVSITNHGLKNLYEKHFKNLMANITVIPPLFPKNALTESQDFQPDKGKIRLGYFGRFFNKIREPQNGLQLINDAIKRYPQPSNQLEIHFFGEDFSEHFKNLEDYPKLKNRLFFHSLVPRERVGELLQKMNFLLNFGNATSFQLPSKAVDYFASGRPIINFQAIKNDTFKTFFKDYPLIVNLLVSEENWQEENIRRFVSFLWEAKNRQVGEDFLMEKVSEFSERSVAEGYLELLKK